MQRPVNKPCQPTKRTRQASKGIPVHQWCAESINGPGADAMVRTSRTSIVFKYLETEQPLVQETSRLAKRH
eukprot:CAMPEP_0184101858 /NCGR_PEP_ID=MMETSP0974-20121125/13049_1 /TAXON_ID=483370 /ORGANISM="non described non described, Strain CCMP2097" /LENGTH=70 /DNA_ID=CAMNT_0026404799 /DNA_START=55 /DNA_END=267 /DNA_ORIENTATION=-